MDNLHILNLSNYNRPEITENKKIIVDLEDGISGTIKFVDQIQDYKVGGMVNCYIDSQELKNSYLVSLSIKPSDIIFL